MSSAPQTKLKNIELLRPFIVLLIVVNHCFAVYSGVWTSPWETAPDIPAYKWIQRVAICCTLQLFTFISGYIYAYQSTKGKKNSFWQLVKKKLQRLILPCVVFGLIYYFIKVPFAQLSVSSFIHNMNNGMGHLWFLPMLFWCFIFTFLLEKLNQIIKLNPWFVLTGLFIISVLSPFCPNVIGLNNALRYWVYFYFGVIYMQHNAICERKPSKGHRVLTIACGAMWGGGNVLIFNVLYIILFIVYYFITDNRVLLDNNKLLYILFKILEFLTKISGILFFMALATYMTNKMKDIPIWIQRLSMMSFGIYIFHQILMDIFYYRTQLPELLGVIWLPMVTLPFVLFISYVLTYLLKRIKLGRLLL